jgi:hypothetical protein
VRRNGPPDAVFEDRKERNISSQWLDLTCECYLDGEIVRGEVRDLSSSGFFVEMAVSLEPGQECELRLVGGEAHHPIRLRGVVESCQAPGTPGAENEPGVQFRLLRFSREYSLLITGESPTEQVGKTTPQVRRTGGDGDGERQWVSEVLGCPVNWWCGWGRKRPGVILDISMVSCQLLVQEAEAPGSVVKIRVPEGIANGCAITLTGEVIRSNCGAAGTRLIVSFGDLSDRVLERLQQILALPGPCRLRGEPLMLEDEAAIALERDRAKHDAIPVDRRHEARSAIRQDGSSARTQIESSQARARQ